MIIPMIDIVFFLLVFFMVGTLYMNTEQQIPLNLHLHRHLQQNLLNLLRLRSPQRTRYISTIRKSSSDRLAERGTIYVKQAPRQAFVIRASKDVYYSEVIALLDMLKVNGAKYISVATERK